MVRKPRVWFPGAKYHITSRGVRKSPLFLDDKDRHQYLHMLFKTKLEYPFTLYTYCLMDNHIHLQMETHETPPGIIMKNLHSNYAKYFNSRYEFSGHLFETRYGSQLIDARDYELDVSRYIHLNPLKAKITNNLADYPWSSFHAYHSDKNPYSLVSTDQILSYFPAPKSTNYLQFLQSTIHIQDSESLDGTFLLFQ